MVILLNLKSLFAFHIILQVPFLEVGQVWATAGFYRIVTCWWDVGGFLLVACVRCVAAVPFWGWGETACPHCQGPSLARHHLGSGGGRLSFFFKSLVIVADGDRCRGCFELLNLLCC